jgi:large subunit ribosomal protein L24
MRIRKGDVVKVVTGKDKNKQGTVSRVDSRKGVVVVEGINIIIRHVKPAPPQRQGGRITQEAPIKISNVVLINPLDNRPTKVGIMRLEDGTKTRISRRTKETIS